MIVGVRDVVLLPRADVMRLSAEARLSPRRRRRAPAEGAPEAVTLAAIWHELFEKTPS